MKQKIYRANKLGESLGEAMIEKKSTNKLNLFVNDLNLKSSYDSVDNLIIICLQHNVDASVLIENLKSDDSTRKRLVAAVVAGAQKIINNK